MSGKRKPPPGTSEVVRTVLDDDTFRRLQLEAEARGWGVEELIVAVLTAASTHLGEILPKKCDTSPGGARSTS